MTGNLAHRKRRLAEFTRLTAAALAVAGFASSCKGFKNLPPDSPAREARGTVYPDALWGKGTRIPVSFPNGTPPRPDWVHQLNGVYQIRIDTFAEPRDGESHIVAAAKKLDYVSALGINCILLNPVAARDANNTAHAFFNYYGVSDPERLDPHLGTPAEFAGLVQKAHGLGLRVLLDVVPHGVTFKSRLLAAHPEWFKKDAAGKITGTWGMADFDWRNPAVREWWISTMCDKWILKYGLDGVRCDCEPSVSGYDLWDKVRIRCEKAGHPLLVMSEGAGPKRQTAYHLGQMDFRGCATFTEAQDFVDTVKQLDESYFIIELSSHDYTTFSTEGKPVFFGYGALLSPLIPLWRMGDEFNSRSVFPTGRTPEDIGAFKTWTTGDQAGPKAVPGKIRTCGKGGHLAQDFGMSGSREVSVRVWTSERSLPNQARLSLYRSAPSFKIKDTLAAPPVAQAVFKNFKAGDWLTLHFDRRLSGHMLLRLDETEGDVGVFGTEGSTYGGSFFSSAPTPADRSFDADIKAQAPATGKNGEVLYFAPLDWASLRNPDKARLQQRIAALLRVRADYSHLLTPFSARMKDRAIVQVPTEGRALRAYACCRGNQAIIVVGNNSPVPETVRLHMPVGEMGLAGFLSYRLERLLNTGAPSRSVREKDLSSVDVEVRPWDVEALLVEGVGSWNRLYGKAPDAAQAAAFDTPLSQDFVAGAPFSKLRVKVFGDAPDEGGVSLSLFKADGSSSHQKGQRPLATFDFKSFSDSDWLELDFKPLPSGKYRWSVAATGKAAGRAGVWRTDGEARTALRSYLADRPLATGNYIAEWR